MRRRPSAGSRTNQPSIFPGQQPWAMPLPIGKAPADFYKETFPEPSPKQHYSFAYRRPLHYPLRKRNSNSPLPGCLSQKCIAQCRLALRQAQGERKRQIPFVLSAERSPCRSTILLFDSTYETASWGKVKCLHLRSKSCQGLHRELLHLRIPIDKYFGCA